MRTDWKLVGAMLVILPSTIPSTAQDGMNHEGHGIHHPIGMEDVGGSELPSEPGQGAFAALAEISTMLRSDPETNWSKVRLDALRDHLIDMDMLISESLVAYLPVEDGIKIVIDLSLPGNAAAGRMVPAHALVLAVETGWSSQIALDDTQIVWTVIDADELATIRALGFFGLMATGNHHRAHHLAIAQGKLEH
ncbi:hypothetical protein [Oricola indica]|jgi:hypothetical protein|uniref:hypothetical protein n=1 Tax=Oricola indica TaxID=2872591 RepID=UPI001CBF2D57|nr:hypothetical protein [Oricola indica]